TTEFLPGVSARLAFENVALFTGVHRGFTPPTDKTAFLSPTDVARKYDSDGALDSERSWNYELGARVDIGEWLRVEPTLFLMDVENLVAAGRKANFENLGKAQYRGLELGVRAEISRRLALPLSAELQLQWTLLDTKIKRGVVSEQGFSEDNDIRGNEAPYAPTNTLRVGATFGFSHDRLRVSWDYNFIDEQFTDFNNTLLETAAGDNGILPSYHFVNLSARYALSQRGLSAFLAVKNMENKIYRASRLHRGSSGIFPGGFRQISLGLNLPLAGSI
ncbi:MAG: TonB-dependent receptor domain-containing protein, partial [Candidatus Zixiibacteriota bacterium]